MGDLLPTYRGVVYPWQCDHMGHMNVSSYVAKFDEASWQLFAALGLTGEYLRRQGRAMAGVEQQISYKRELYAGDTIYASSGVIQVRQRAIQFFHEMRHSVTHELVALTTLTAVHIDAATRRACALPDNVREQAQRHMAEAPQ